MFKREAKLMVVILLSPIILGLLAGVVTPKILGPSDKDLMTAVMYSFSLEKMAFDLKDNFTTYDSVFTFMRQGFGPKISKKIADSLWNDNQLKLKAGNSMMEMPSNVEFKTVSIDRALATFNDPQSRKDVWGDDRIVMVLIKKEDDHWKLFNFED